MESESWDQQVWRVWFLGCCSSLSCVCLLRNLCNDLEVIPAAEPDPLWQCLGPHPTWISEQKRHTWAMGREFRVHPSAAAACYGGRCLVRHVGYVIRMRVLYTANCEGVWVLFIKYLLTLARICYQTSWYTSVQTFLPSDLHCYNWFLLMVFLLQYK